MRSYLYNYVHVYDKNNNITKEFSKKRTNKMKTICMVAQMRVKLKVIYWTIMRKENVNFRTTIFQEEYFTFRNISVS